MEVLNEDNERFERSFNDLGEKIVKKSIWCNFSAANFLV